MSEVTVTDLFCGAGGSTTGALDVPGVRVRMAANHWQTAIDTHQANHPDIDHDCADVSQVDPRRYPSTDLLWASPECTHHSQAQGRPRPTEATSSLLDALSPDPADTAAGQRSRATMWDIVRFAEHHHYRALIVENVVDAARWVLWPAWRHALDVLGYCVHTIWLNSMHAATTGPPAPQSRDRLYVLAHTRAHRPRGLQCPDLATWTRPTAWCPTCQQHVSAVQAWKRPDRPRWGRYRAQYLYRCPATTCRNTVVEPATLPAAAVIDWDLPGQRIGDRTRPLAVNTRRRIAAGIARYWYPPHPTNGDTTGQGHGHEPARADTSPLGVAPALITELRGGGSTARPATHPLATVTASGNHHALITRNNNTRATHSGPEMTTPITAAAELVDDVFFRMLTPTEIQAAMAFPRAYVLHGTRSDVIRQLGNAVTPPAARDLLAALTHTLTGTDPRDTTTATRRPTAPVPGDDPAGPGASVNQEVA